MTYVKVSVKRAAGSPGVGINTRDELVLVDVDDIAFFPERDSAGVVMEEDIVLKPGRYGIGLYLTPGTVEAAAASDGDTDQVGYKPSVKGTHPGNNREVREFKANWINRKVIAIVRYCGGKAADIIGSPCNPCKMTASYTGNNESNTNEFTFEQISKGDDIGIYQGSIPQEEPVAVVDASAEAVPYVADGQYQLSPGKASVTEVTGGHHGALVTLLGVAGESPAVTASESLLLRDGKAFAAVEGAQISLRAYSVAEGRLVWVEQSRYTPA